jgi:hypothetical protein
MEIWKDVVGYEGLYKVSSYGRIKSIPRNSTIKEERILKAKKNHKGYYQAVLYKNGVRKHFQVHRLVAIAFIENNENLPQVNHKDENKDNNCVYNLEWCTNEYNNSYGTKNKRSGISQSKRVIGISTESGLIVEYDSLADATREGYFYGSAICRCCNGELKQYKRYKWYYLD